MSNIGVKVKRLLANASKGRFFAIETAREFVDPIPRLRILFSENCAGKDLIKKGFKMLKHQVDFDVILPEKMKDYDLVVPLNMEDLYFMQNFPELTKNNLIPIPSIESTVICDDKFLFDQTLVEKGFGQYLPHIGHNLSFPFLVKKKVSYAGAGCYFIYNEQQKEQYTNFINNDDYFCQEIIKGDKEYDIHILFKNHQVVTSFTIENSFEKDTYLKGVDEFICTRIVKSPHLPVFAEILDAIGFEGLCCFNYKENNGKPSIFEINPRFDGSLSRYFFTFLRHLN